MLSGPAAMGAQMAMPPSASVIHPSPVAPSEYGALLATPQELFDAG